MIEVTNGKSNILSALKNAAGSGESKEELFGFVFDLFGVAKHSAIESELEMCEDVLTQMIGYVEDEARIRIANRLASLDDAPRRVMQRLSLEPINIAKPVLMNSTALQDDDLINVVRQCGADHLVAIADRKIVTMPVTTELIRMGNTQVWEQLAQNKGAILADKSFQFLTNRAHENEKIQKGLIERPDLPQSVVEEIISQASESVREQLVKSGRGDLMAHLDKAKSVVESRVTAKDNVLGIEFDSAYAQALRHQKLCSVKNIDILEAAQKDNFPRVCAMFAIVADFDLEDAVYWLSMPKIEPAIVAFKVLNFREELVSALLNVGPWSKILNDEIRQKAMRAYANLTQEKAKRLYLERLEGFNLQQVAA
ncbi:MAG: DUF2336 domain-containing protein [Hyphomicrobiales bacterium]